MPGHVIDGNDLLAVHEAMAEAAARARHGEGPSLLELITYRLDPHTTADDAGKYRSEEEVQPWLEKDPLHRFSLFLRTRNLLDDARQEALQAGVRGEMQTAVEELEALPSEDPARLFSLTFAQPTPALQAQRAAWRVSLPDTPHKE
jgi:pyruvate dehydrogenase E1 component alpha subunit